MLTKTKYLSYYKLDLCFNDFDFQFVFQFFNFIINKSHETGAKVVKLQPHGCKQFSARQNSQTHVFSKSLIVNKNSSQWLTALQHLELAANQKSYTWPHFYKLRSLLLGDYIPTIFLLYNQLALKIQRISIG